jgi:prephenate dehydrogenase
MDYRDIGIVGVGLIGGSIALAALEKGYKVSLYEPIEKLDRFDGAVPARDLTSLVQQSEIVFLAAPLAALPGIATALVPLVQPGQIVSDVASLKMPAVEALASALRQRCHYVPSHPMAGSEKSGSDSARKDLFAGAVTIVCPEFAREQSAADRIATFWEDLGTRVLFASAREHDEWVGAVSHFPHLLAVLLMKHIAESSPEMLQVAGTGFKDMTRVAAGSPSLWIDILLANRATVVKHIRQFSAELENALGIVEAEDRKRLQALLDDAKENRDKLQM